VLEQLVAVARVVAEDEEDGRLREPLETSAHPPTTGAETTAAAGAARELLAASQIRSGELQCKTHIRASLQIEQPRPGGL
jgi:hypothetical protein